MGCPVVYLTPHVFSFRGPQGDGGGKWGDWRDCYGEGAEVD